MTYNLRKGIRAKNIWCTFTDARRTGSTNSTTSALTDSQFTGRAMDLFWAAYYGDLAMAKTPGGALTNFYLKDLGFVAGTNGVNVVSYFTAGSTVCGTISNTIAGETIQITGVTTLTANAFMNEYVIIAKANGKKVFARINSHDNGTITLDDNMSTYGVALGDSVALLKIPFGLTMTAWQRVDHIATDLSLEPPATETEDTYFLGTEDDAGSQNMNVDETVPTKFVGSVTIRGGVIDLLRLKYGVDSTVPASRTRYNLGSEPSSLHVGFTAIWTTAVDSVTGSDQVTKCLFCNDIVVKNVGILNTINADKRAEAKVDFEVKGPNCRLEVISAQANDTDNNV